MLWAAIGHARPEFLARVHSGALKRARPPVPPDGKQQIGDKGEAMWGSSVTLRFHEDANQVTAAI
jgi:hypothetical protein